MAHTLRYTKTGNNNTRRKKKMKVTNGYGRTAEKIRMFCGHSLKVEMRRGVVRQIRFEKRTRSTTFRCPLKPRSYPVSLVNGSYSYAFQSSSHNWLVCVLFPLSHEPRFRYDASQKEGFWKRNGSTTKAQISPSLFVPSVLPNQSTIPL